MKWQEAEEKFLAEAKKAFDDVRKQWESVERDKIGATEFKALEVGRRLSNLALQLSCDVESDGQGESEETKEEAKPEGEAAGASVGDKKKRRRRA